MPAKLCRGSAMSTVLLNLGHSCWAYLSLYVLVRTLSSQVRPDSIGDMWRVHVSLGEGRVQSFKADDNRRTLRLSYRHFCWAGVAKVPVLVHFRCPPAVGVSSSTGSQYRPQYALVLISATRPKMVFML